MSVHFPDKPEITSRIVTSGLSESLYTGKIRFTMNVKSFLKYSILNTTFSSIKNLTLLFLLFISFSHSAQTTVKISGRAFDKENDKLPLPRLMIINIRTSNGVFADAEGKFAISAYQTDTLLFSVIGYNTKKVCLKDSIIKPQYYIEVNLQKTRIVLKEISIFAPRTLRDIDKDIAMLDSTRRSRYKDIDALSSPITYLYERFSKFGKSKQRVAEWENEDLRRNVLKDLFRLYIRHEIIDLNEDEFDAFITYCNLSEEFIKNSTQLELVNAIKGKYEAFNANKDYYKPHEKRW